VRSKILGLIFLKIEDTWGRQGRKYPTRYNNVSKFYCSIFIWRSTCFGRHTAHHQEPKTVLAACGFSYRVQCVRQRLLSTHPASFYIWKTRGCQYSFRLL